MSFWRNKINDIYSRADSRQMKYLPITDWLLPVCWEEYRKPFETCKKKQSIHKVESYKLYILFEFCSVNTKAQYEQHSSSGLFLSLTLVGKELPYLLSVLIFPWIVSVGMTQEQEQISAIPGTAGRDYPAYTKAPRTSFTCEGLSPGFYSDPEGECQVYHHCTHTAAKPSFTRLCPIGKRRMLATTRWCFCSDKLSSDWDWYCWELTAENIV